jgi:DNA-binding CsgD family transcriptional regulator
MSSTGQQPRSDYVALVEASYQLEGGDQEWLTRICDQAAPSFDVGLGVFAFCYDLRSQTERMPVITGTGLPPELGEMVETMIRNCPREELRAFCGEQINCGAAMDRFRAQNLDYDELFARYGAPTGLCDARYATVPAGEGFGIMIGGYAETRASVPLRTRSMWRRTLSHISLGLRLRRLLAADDGGPADGEAVLRADGRVEHAEGETKSRSMRDALRDAARRIDRARGRLRREAPEESLELWRGLVSGRWSLVDRFDSDGRRFLVAHRNPPDVVDVRRLSARQRQIARLVVRGYPAKLIAYQLGLSRSAVSSQLTLIRQKLGARSNAELVQLLQSLGQSGSTGGGEP